MPLPLGRKLALSALLLGLSQAAGLSAQGMAGDGLPTARFIADELDGQSPMASYYRGLRAYRDGQFALAQPLLQQAQRELPGIQQQLQASFLLGESAYHNRDWPVVARTLGMLPRLTPEQMVMLAETRFALGQREQGRQLLEALRTNPPRDSALRARGAELERWLR
jgi:TolA-binding protein